MGNCGGSGLMFNMIKIYCVSVLSTVLESVSKNILYSLINLLVSLTVRFLED